MESTLNPVPVHREIESPISYDHTSLMGKCVNINSLVWIPFLNQFRPPFECQLDLTQIPESIAVFIPVPFESKLIISQNHTSFLDKNVDENDSVIIFKN